MYRFIEKIAKNGRFWGGKVIFRVGGGFRAGLKFFSHEYCHKTWAHGKIRVEVDSGQKSELTPPPTLKAFQIKMPKLTQSLPCHGKHKMLFAYQIIFFIPRNVAPKNACVHFASQGRKSDFLSTKA